MNEAFLPSSSFIWLLHAAKNTIAVKKQEDHGKDKYPKLCVTIMAFGLFFQACAHVSDSVTFFKLCRSWQSYFKIFACNIIVLLYATTKLSCNIHHYVLTTYLRPKSFKGSRSHFHTFAYYFPVLHYQKTSMEYCMQGKFCPCFIFALFAL